MMTVDLGRIAWPCPECGRDLFDLLTLKQARVAHKRLGAIEISVLHDCGSVARFRVGLLLPSRQTAVKKMRSLNVATIKKVAT